MTDFSRIQASGVPLLVRRGEISREMVYQSPLVGLPPEFSEWGKWPALMVVASDNPDPAVFSALVNEGFDPLETNSLGYNALMAACQFNRNEKMAEMCLEHGVPVDAKDGFGIKAIHWCALGFGSVRHLNLLFREGADVHDRDHNQRTPLFCAAGQRKKAWLIRHLVARGADVDAAEYRGRTPLMEALWHGRVANALALLDCGADPSVKDESLRVAGLYYQEFLEAKEGRRPDPRLVEHLGLGNG